ncbi:MAG TPA: aldo/keto reductase [Candidatus Dormibacteraeota bacterium]|nr:aldo/keto reductase [Candidatus Dormibacteraeota bacterium]
MKQRLFGKTGVAVPVIGQGTWDIPERGDGRAHALAALRRGIELGMTHVDTAEMYGAGRVEEIVGEAIAGIARDGLFIASKVLPSNASFEGTLAACDASLRRLRLDYLDLYMLHWPSEYPLAETMRAFERLVRDGKTRFVGVSNFELEEMQEAMRDLRDVPLACNQVLYHLRERGVERRLIPAARDAQAAVVAYTPFGRGSFPRALAAPGGVLDRVARKHGVTPRTVILAFLTREPNVFTIPKASSITHVEENARAGDLQLDAEDVAAIDAASPMGPDGPLATL